MMNRLAVFKTGVSEDRRLFTELIEGLWERASSMLSDSPLKSCGREWGALAEGAAAALAEMVGWENEMIDFGEEDAEAAWWERVARAGFRVTIGEREVHPAGRRGVSALESAFLFAMVSGFTGAGENETVSFNWQGGAPAVSGRLPGGGAAVLAASRRGAEKGGLGMIVGMARRRRGKKKVELLLEAVLPTTANRVLTIRLEA